MSLSPLFEVTERDSAAWEKFQRDARDVPENPAVRVCRSRKCRRPVWDGLTAKNGKPNAFDVRPDGTATGTSHYRTCLDVQAFRH